MNSPMTWTEIRNGSVPSAGDEMISIDPDTGGLVDLIVVTPGMVKEWTWQDYRNDWFFYFRPLNLPKYPARADNGDPDTIVPAPAPHKKHPGYANGGSR